MPEGAVYVGRPTKWGNPWTVINGYKQGWLVYDDRDRYGLAPSGSTSGGFIAAYKTRAEAQSDAVRRYRKWLRSSPELVRAVVDSLSGRDLVCWCREGDPCHVDPLLELANGGAS